MNALVEGPLGATGIRAEAKKNFLESFDGPVIVKTYVYGANAVKQIFKRDDPIFARNAHFISFFARIIFSKEIVDPIELHVKSKLEELNKYFETRVQWARSVMKDAGIEDSDSAHANQPMEIQARITSPLHRKMLDVMKVADGYLLMLSTLWLHGAIESPEHSTHLYDVKRRLRSLIAFVRNTWIGLQKRSHLAQKGEAASAALATVGAIEAAAGNDASATTGAAILDEAERTTTAGRKKAKPETSSGNTDASDSALAQAVESPAAV